MYAGHVHSREQRTGHFWQGRFGCVAMDEAHLVAAMAYVTLNPVRATLVDRAEDWPWSSIHAYGRPAEGDGVTHVEAVKPYLEAAMRIINAGEEDGRFDALRRSETIGRPIGMEGFLRRAEEQVGRTLKPRKRGPKPAESAGSPSSDQMHCHRNSCHRNSAVIPFAARNDAATFVCSVISIW